MPRRPPKGYLYPRRSGGNLSNLSRKAGSYGINQPVSNEPGKYYSPSGEVITQPFVDTRSKFLGLIPMGENSAQELNRNLDFSTALANAQVPIALQQAKGMVPISLEEARGREEIKGKGEVATKKELLKLENENSKLAAFNAGNHAFYVKMAGQLGIPPELISNPDVIKSAYDAGIASMKAEESKGKASSAESKNIEQRATGGYVNQREIGENIAREQTARTGAAANYAQRNPSELNAAESAITLAPVIKSIRDRMVNIPSGETTFSSASISPNISPFAPTPGVYHGASSEVTEVGGTDIPDGKGGTIHIPGKIAQKRIPGSFDTAIPIPSPNPSVPINPTQTSNTATRPLVNPNDIFYPPGQNPNMLESSPKVQQSLQGPVGNSLSDFYNYINREKQKKRLIDFLSGVQ